MSGTRNLIIDAQLLQTSAWHRGMGKYLLQILQELNKQPPADMRVVLLLNDRLNDDADRYETLRYLLPNVELIRTDLPLPGNKQTLAAAKVYQRTLTTFLDDRFSDAENFYLLTALFLFDFFAEFPDNCHRLVLFYDLTPLLFWRDLGGYFPPDLYMPRFQRLLEAQHIFAISDTTRRDLLKVFGINPATVTNINGGYIKVAEHRKRPSNFTVPERYILFPTGNLPHKNNEVAVRGFERYRQTAVDTKLLITSRFDDAAREHLLSMSDGVVFTGNVQDEELEWLYEHAQAVLFASKYEGLGMPVLDAVANQKPVVASRIQVFEEMSKDAFYYFEPDDEQSLCTALTAALKPSSAGQKIPSYAAIMAKYTWQQSADTIRWVIGKLRPTEPPALPNRRPRIAVACINPGIGDQIGRFAEPLYASLCQEFQVDFYFDGNGVHFREMERPTFLDYQDCHAYDISKLDIKAYQKYCLVVYLLDDASVPSRLAQRAAVLPGAAILAQPKQDDAPYRGFLKLATDNQNQVYTYSGNSYQSYQQIKDDLIDLLDSQAKGLSKQEAILRGRGTNGAIIRRLKALAENET